MMQAGSGKNGPAFLSTHPAGDQRIAELQAYVPKVLPLYEAALQNKMRATTQR